MFGMQNMRKELQRKEQELIMLRSQLQKNLQNAPEGRLRISHKRGKPQYYQRKCCSKSDLKDQAECCSKSDTKDQGKYIRKSDIALARGLAQKDYEEKLLKEINLQLEIIQKCLRDNNPSALSSVYEQISTERKKLINAHILSEEEYAKKWMEKEYSGKGFAVNESEIYTEKNERVRSKSEKILADKFYLKGIPYKYECPLELKGYGKIYPDFTVLNKRTRQVFYWEHLGMMDDPLYSEKAIKKVECYEKNRIYPGKQETVNNFV